MALTNKLTAIGDAIREKTGKSALLSLDEMPVEIRAIETGGGGDVNIHEWEDWRLSADQMYDIIDVYTNDRITKISDYAMAGTSYRKAIFSNVEEVSQYAFYQSGYSFGTISEQVVSLPKAKKVGAYAFGNLSALVEVPLLEEITGQQAFTAYKGTTIDLPNLKKMTMTPFANSKIEELSLPSMEGEIPMMGFYAMTSLKKLDLGPNVSSFANNVSIFTNCKLLGTLILRTNGVVSLPNNSIINSTMPIYKGTGYIYVPAAVIEDYKVAANWAPFAAQFRAIEDYPDICGEA